MKKVLFISMFIVGLFSGDYAVAQNCGSCEWHRDNARQIALECVYDIENNGGVSRYNLDFLRSMVSDYIQCARACSDGQTTETYSNILELIDVGRSSGGFRSPEPIVDNFR